MSLKDITFTKTGGRLVNKLDISRIKVNSSNYSSFFELQIDISWFIHNCLIEFSKNEVVCQAAKNLAKFVDEEIESIKKCIECYEKAYKFPMESFVMPCDKPHLLVWAQAPGWVFWPAKAMSVTNGSIHVRFFEDHSVLNLPPTECFLFSDPSKHYPGNKKCTSETFLAALKVIQIHSFIYFKIFLNSIRYKIKYRTFQEANAYIDNVRQKFGAFIYAPQKTPLNPEKLQDHVNDMIGKKTVLNALSTTQKSNDESTINVVVSNLDAIPKSPAMVAGHNQTVVNITNQRKTSIQNYPENNQKRYEPPNKKIRVGSGSDSDEELLQNYLVQSRQKKKQKDEEIEAYKRRIFEEEQKMATQKKDHANEIQDLEKDFDHSKKTFQSQISEKDQEIVLLKEKIAQLEQEITNRSQKKTELLCFECGEASDSVFFCSNQCTNNHFKLVMNDDYND